MRRCREVAEHRSKLYWFLGEFYLEPPTRQNLQELHSQLNTRPHARPDATESLLDELQAIFASAPDLERYAHELDIEYTRIFHGIKDGSILAPPYESVHRESRLIGETTKGVVEAYAAAGYENIYAAAGPQDHLGVELRFLSLLCFDELQSWTARDIPAVQKIWTRQSDFLDRHVLAWVPKYCDALERESNTRYYQIIAQLTCHALKNDRQLLRELSNQFGMN